jgi:hypothetical protein
MLAPSVEMKVAALYDPWVFCDMLEYQGGTRAFESCHYEFVLVMAAYQLYQSGHLVGNQRKKYNQAVGLPDDDTSPPASNRLLQMPRGHFKSSLVQLYILWRIYRNPNIRILDATNIKDLSQAFIRELRTWLEDAELGETIWNLRPHIQGNLIPPLNKYDRRHYAEENDSTDKRIVWSNTQVQVIRGEVFKEPTVFSTSVGSKATGQHFDVIIMDDVVDYDNSRTAVKIASHRRWAADISSVKNKVKTRSLCGVTPDGTEFWEDLGDEMVVTGTHYDPGDYYVFLKSKAAILNFVIFSRNIYKNGTDNLEGYLYSKFTETMEKQLRAELEETPGVFEAQYLNLVNPKNLQLFSESCITWVSDKQLAEGIDRLNHSVRFTSPYGDGVEQLEPVIAVDFAISLTDRADMTAIAVGGVSVTGRFVVLAIKAGHFSVEATVAEIVALTKKWSPRRVYCESIGFQALYTRHVMDALKEEQVQAAVLPYKPQGNKQHRINAKLGPFFASEEIMFPRSLKNQRHIMNTFAYFGRASTKDDPPDALAVVAEHSFKPKNQVHNGRRRNHFIFGEQHEFNTRYGGLY